MSDFWVVTSGKGMLPASVKVGHIAAKDAESAETALVASGQIPPRFKAHFSFEPKQ